MTVLLFINYLMIDYSKKLLKIMHSIVFALDWLGVAIFKHQSSTAGRRISKKTSSSLS